MVKVIDIQPKDLCQIRVTLSNGKQGVFDVSPYLEKGIFKELKDENYFQKAKISFGSIVWPNSQDFSADTIEYELKQIQ